MNGLKKIRIWRPVPDGVQPETVDAGPTPVPGLVVIWYRWGAAPGWEVIHEASGFAVADADSPEHALAVAEALGGLADWTRPASELQQVPGLPGAVIRTVKSAGGHFFGPQVSAEMLAVSEASAGGAP